MSKTEPPENCSGLPPAVTAELLSSQRRCRLITALAAAGGDAIAEDLVAAVFAAESDPPPGDVPEARAEVERDLFEHHLPKLTATGLVEYDSMLGRFELVEPTLARLARRELSADRLPEQ